MRQRALNLPLREEHVEVSVLHVLSDHAERVRGHAHAQQPDDVGVVEARHYLDFLEEVVPDKTGVSGEFNQRVGARTSGNWFQTLQILLSAICTEPPNVKT